MKDTAFQELLTSVRQAGRIRRGTLKPARVTALPSCYAEPCTNLRPSSQSLPLD